MYEKGTQLSKVFKNNKGMFSMMNTKYSAKTS